MITSSLNAFSQKNSFKPFDGHSNEPDKKVEPQKTDKQKFDDNLRNNIKNNGIPNAIIPPPSKPLLKIYNQLVEDEAPPPPPPPPPASKTEKEPRITVGSAKRDF